MSLSLHTSAATNMGAIAPQTESADVVNNLNDSDSMKNEFLTLMVSQIQNQDPLNPTDGTEYVSQLAQFAQVESSENMVSLMQNNALMMDNLQVLATAGLVGKSVLIHGNEFTVDAKEGQSVAGQVELTTPSSQVNLLIEDRYGKKQTVHLGAQAAGPVNFELDLDDLDLAEGDYSISVELSRGQNYAPIMKMAGEVDSINIPTDGGASQVSIRGLGTVPFYDISQFGKSTYS